MKPLLIVCILFVQQLNGQDIITVSGVVLNQSTKHPVPWASISVKAKSLGTLAGDSGNFQLHLPADLKNDTLIISSVGFKNLKLCIKDFLDGHVREFLLAEETTQLSEIVVASKQLSAKEIMKRAYKRINDNYVGQPYMLRAFYRDYKKVNGKYVSLLEAATKIYDKGYSDEIQEEIFIEEIRRSKRFINQYEPFVSSWNLLRNLMGMNDVKYKTRSLNVQGNRYRLDSTITHNGEPIYIISTGNHRLFKIFVRQSDYGIIRVEYQGDFREIKHPSNHQVNDSIEYIILNIRGVTEFRDYNEKLYLSHMIYSWNTQNRNIKSRKVSYDTYFFQQLVVNDIVLNAPPFKENVMADTTLEVQAGKYNESFWANYNVPQQDDKIESVLSDLVKDSNHIPFEKNSSAIERQAQSSSTRDSCDQLAEPSARIGCLLKVYHDKFKIPASQISVMHKGRIVYSDAFGFIDVDKKIPATPSSLFRIASVSKTLTSFLALQLAAKKRVDLTLPIGVYLPELPPVMRRITTYQLGTHTGGIRDYRDHEDFYRIKQYWSMRESIPIFRDDSLMFEPGKGFLYSSFGFNLLGAALEGATGKDYLGLLDQIVLKPLNMLSTTGSDISGESVTRYYILKDGIRAESPLENLSYKWSSGGLISTTDDLVKFGEAVLSEQRQDKWFRESISTPFVLPSGEITAYSFGWYIDTDADGEVVIHHPGSAPGYSSHLLIYPDKEIVIAYLANTGVNTFFNKAFADEIVLLVSGH